MKLLETDLPKFEPDIYGRIAMNDLVTYAVYFLAQDGREISAEDIVAACFKLFPERFHLRGYAEWPDSTVVNKRWVDCRDKGLLHGSTAEGFSLTPKGLALAEKTAAVLTGKRQHFARPGTRNVGGEMRTRAGRFVRALEGSDAFKAYSIDAEAPRISEFDFRNMLLCTMESSASTLRSNLDQFKQHASLYQRDDLLKFLNFCQTKFTKLLNEGATEEPKFRGGMIKQKLT
ncbi:MAG: hypothetical protein FJ167_03030 [Gammaproteobacteria bacterium]|nr:hypothetical protein [Gammaproteobacteria bacterium]